jgi:hypothetical protein
MIGQFQGQRAGEVLDGTDLFEDLTEALVEEPTERLMLYCEEIGKGENFGDLPEREALSHARRSQEVPPWRYELERGGGDADKAC